MKLCFVSSFPPNKANLSEYGNYLVNSFIKNKNIDETIVLANKHENSPKIEKKRKLLIIRCWKNDSILIPLNILKIINKLNVDLVYFNIHMMSWGRSKLANIMAALTPFLVKKLLRKKVVVTLHNIHDMVDLNRIKIMKPNKFVLFGLWLITRFILSVDAVTITLKKYVKIMKKKYYKDNIYYIPHGTLSLNIKEPVLGKKTILGFGYWGPGKNLSLLVEAFKDLVKEDSEVKLLIAGSSHPVFPDFIENYKMKYKDVPVKFIGYVPENELKKVFDQSTVIVLPYNTTTGASGVLNLACSFGKPIISSDLKDIREYVKDLNMDVSFVNLDNKEQLKRAIKNIIYDKQLQKKMAWENLKAAEKFTFDSVSYMITDIFRKIIEIKNKRM